MNISPKQKKLTSQLKENFSQLEKSLKTLEYSYKNCLKIIHKKTYSSTDLEKLEAFTSRFARTADILTQKVFKNIFIILNEDIKTFLDGANFLEKLEIVKKGDDLLTIRELRNQISHDYFIESIEELFRNCFKYTPLLLKTIQTTKKYIAKFV